MKLQNYSWKIWKKRNQISIFIKKFLLILFPNKQPHQKSPPPHSLLCLHSLRSLSLLYTVAGKKRRSLPLRGDRLRPPIVILSPPIDIRSPPERRDRHSISSRHRSSFFFLLLFSIWFPLTEVWVLLGALTEVWFLLDSSETDSLNEPSSWFRFDLNWFRVDFGLILNRFWFDFGIWFDLIWIDFGFEKCGWCDEDWRWIWRLNPFVGMGVDWRTQFWWRLTNPVVCGYWFLEMMFLEMGVDFGVGGCWFLRMCIAFGVMSLWVKVWWLRYWWWCVDDDGEVMNLGFYFQILWSNFFIQIWFC